MQSEEDRHGHSEAASRSTWKRTATSRAPGSHRDGFYGDLLADHQT